MRLRWCCKVDVPLLTFSFSCLFPTCLGSVWKHGPLDSFSLTADSSLLCIGRALVYALYRCSASQSTLAVSLLLKQALSVRRRDSHSYRSHVSMFLVHNKGCPLCDGPCKIVQSDHRANRGKRENVAADAVTGSYIPSAALVSARPCH